MEWNGMELHHFARFRNRVGYRRRIDKRQGLPWSGKETTGKQRKRTCEIEEEGGGGDGWVEKKERKKGLVSES